jgi:hypothetical protein
MVNILSIYYKNCAKPIKRNRKKQEKDGMKNFYSLRILICGVEKKIGKSGAWYQPPREKARLDGEPTPNYDAYLHCYSSVF